MARFVQRQLLSRCLNFGLRSTAADRDEAGNRSRSDQAANPLPQRASAPSLAVLRHPDRRTSWVVCLVAHLRAPLGGGQWPAVGLLEERVERIHWAVPIVGARLRAETWYPGAPPRVVVCRESLSDLGPVPPGLSDPFDLGATAPLRIVCDGGGQWVAVAGHHAAFDGLGLAAILGCLLDGSVPAAAPTIETGVPRRLDVRPWKTLARLALPADSVVPSTPPPTLESFCIRPVELGGGAVTARLAEAATAAIVGRNLTAGRPPHRVGISVGIGGPPGVGNVASYRRVDLSPLHAVAPAVSAAVHSGPTPPELASLPRIVAPMLRPLVGRLSDTVLVSNLGRVNIKGVGRLDFFPVARGASGLALGAAGVPGGISSLSLRATHLDPPDLAALLDRSVANWTRAASQAPAGLRLPSE